MIPHNGMIINRQRTLKVEFQETRINENSYAFSFPVNAVVCARHVACIFYSLNIHRLSRGCKPLMGELAKPISEPQGRSG